MQRYVGSSVLVSFRQFPAISFAATPCPSFLIFFYLRQKTNRRDGGHFRGTQLIAKWLLQPNLPHGCPRKRSFAVYHTKKAQFIK